MLSSVWKESRRVNSFAAEKINIRLYGKEILLFFKRIYISNDCFCFKYHIDELGAWLVPWAENYDPKMQNGLNLLLVIWCDMTFESSVHFSNWNTNIVKIRQNIFQRLHFIPMTSFFKCFRCFWRHLLLLWYSRFIRFDKKICV